jgi:hypothetical protein
LERQRLKCTVLINIPATYRKWGPLRSIPQSLNNYENVIIFSPKVDYGPATKLLGALEYVQNRPEITHIITVDDDELIKDPQYLAYLSAYASVIPDCAITFGGIKLNKFPFRFGDGLFYDNEFSFVDVPAGYKAVLYPVKGLRDSKVPFELFGKLPSGIFNDDDAYFGVMLSVLNIPLFAIPDRPGGIPIRQSKNGGGSAVVELADKERCQNEMEIFQYAVSQGYLNSRNTNCRLNAFKRCRLAVIYGKELLRSVIRKSLIPAIKIAGDDIQDLSHNR